MPRRALTDEARDALTLRALRGESPTALANEFNVTRDYVHKLINEAKDKARRKLAFWQEANRVIRDTDDIRGS